MQHSRDLSIWPTRGAACWLTLAFLVVLTYASTLIGPVGIHYEPRDPWDALNALRDIRFVTHGSDQRADWMGNLLMLVPYGFLVTAAIWPRRTFWLKPLAFVLALLLCLATVLVVKYLQLFFPPRTVTLNYVAAQMIGSLIGCVGFILWYGRVAPALLRRHDPVRALVIALRLYFFALAIFLLMPLDFALNLHDLDLQVMRLPDALTALPGEGRPMAVRVLLLEFSVAAFVPVGMLLSFVNNRGDYRVRRSLGAVTCWACC
ncbi:MAG: VanZ family protein [Rhodopila sp.]